MRKNCESLRKEIDSYANVNIVSVTSFSKNRKPWKKLALGLRV